MKLTQLDLNLFPVLDAIYRQRSLTRAAEALCVTQPAVSNALNRLRACLGDPLFVRSAGGVRPTAYTEEIIDQVREALNLLERSADRGEVFDPAISRRVFRLSMNGALEEMLAPYLARRAMECGGSVGLTCHYAKRAAAARELATGALDIAFDMEIPGVDERLVVEPLFSQPLVCAIAEDHPLSGAPMTLEAFLGLDHVLVSSRRRGPGFEDAALARLGRKRRIRCRVQNYNVAKQLVRQSQMALILPRALADGAGLRLVEPPFPLPPLSSNFYWPKNMTDDPAHQWLRESIRDGLRVIAAMG